MSRLPSAGVRAAALALALGFAALGCSGPPPAPATGGRWHVLEAGETVYSVSRRYGVPVSDLIAATDIGDVRDLPIGARLWIPDAQSPDDPWIAPGTEGRPPRPLPAPRTSPYQRPLEFAWPLRGRLTSRYGARHRGLHEGIDLAAPPGTLVRASEAGRVTYAGRLGEYGLTVVVRHDAEFSTVYAHHRKNRVAAGHFVDKGDVVGEVGSSGNATGPHLHFEIRRNQRPTDPLEWLP